MGVTIDGTDLTTLDIVYSEVRGFRESPTTDYPLARIPGWDGEVHLSQEKRGTTRAKRVQVIGAYRKPFGPNAHAAILTELDELKIRVSRRVVRVVFGDQTDRYIDGVLESLIAPTIAPYETQRMLGMEASFLCADPFAYAVSESLVDFTSGATALTLGSAHSWGEFDIVGPVTNPILIYRNSSGVEQGRWRWVGTVAAGEHLEVHMQNQLITLDDVDAAAEFDDLTDFFAFDPHDGVIGGASPTIEISPGGTATSATVRFRKRWG